MLALTRDFERSRMVNLRDVERRAAAADMRLCALIDESDREREQIARLREQVGGLEERRRALRAPAADGRRPR